MINTTKKHSINVESFRVTLNLRASFTKANEEMNRFCTTWRDKRKAKSGGINGNHRQLWYHILSILPHEMDRIRNEKVSIFEHLDSSGHYALFTNRMQLVRLMTQTVKDGCVLPSLSTRTINNLISRLIEANLIIEKLNYTTTGTLCKTGQGNFLLILNGKFIEKYSQYKPKGTNVKNINLSDSSSVSNKGTMKDVHQPTNRSIVQINNINNRCQDVENSIKAESAEADNLKIEIEEVQREPGSENQDQKSKHSAKKDLHSNKKKSKESTYFDLLYESKNNVIPKTQFSIESIWKLARIELWNGALYNSEVNRVSKELIANQLKDLRDKIEEWREQQIERYRNSDKYKALSEYKRIAREKYMRDIYLPDARKTAFEILISAIRIQANNAKKKGYKIYYPTVYFSKKFGFAGAVKYAEKEWFNMRRLRNSKRNDRIVEIAKLKVWSSRTVGNAYETKRKHGTYKALINLDNAIDKVKKAWKSMKHITESELQNCIQATINNCKFS